MDNALQAIFTWQFLLFCLAVFGITSVIRKVVEYLLANNKFVAKESKVWRDLILPILPAIVGVVFALVAKAYPYPVNMAATSARAAWGLAGGLLSGLGYRVVNSFVTAFIVSKIPGAVVKDSNLEADPIAAAVVNAVVTEEKPEDKK